MKTWSISDRCNYVYIVYIHTLTISLIHLISLSLSACHIFAGVQRSLNLIEKKIYNILM